VFLFVCPCRSSFVSLRLFPYSILAHPAVDAEAQRSLRILRSSPAGAILATSIVFKLQKRLSGAGPRIGNASAFVMRCVENAMHRLEEHI
jgi:hypothetical protein